jgi:hypothetical protein
MEINRDISQKFVTFAQLFKTSVMIKIRIFVCALIVLCAFSCRQDDNPASLSGTQWGTTIQQVEVLLSFSNNTNGTLRLSDPSQGINENMAFTYTYNNPNVVLRPSDPEYAASYPNGIKASVHGRVMDFTDFFMGEQISLVKK